LAESNRHDDYERFVRLFVAGEGRLRAFIRTLVPTLDDVDEVVQETALVAWRKFHEFDLDTSFFAWVATIGRFEVLRRRREYATRQTVFSESLLDLLADEAVNSAEMDMLAAQRRALELCLKKLPDQQRKWLLAAYQPGVKIREVAQKSGKSVQAFYKTLQRLRSILLECILREMDRQAST